MSEILDEINAMYQKAQEVVDRFITRKNFIESVNKYSKNDAYLHYLWSRYH